MDKVPNTKRVIWGAKVDTTLTGKVRVMSVLTGVTCPFLSGEVQQKAPPPQIPREVVKPLREAMEHMVKAQEALPREKISKAAVFSKEK
jgi:cell division protein FtsZ